MRTSNKILLGAFVATILIVTGIHVSLSAKIKKGELVVLHRVNPAALEHYSFSPVKFVVVKGMQECRIIQSDTGSLEMRKNWKNQFTYTISADTLIIAGIGSDNSVANGRRVYTPVDVYLPPVESIVAINSGVFLRGADDSSAAVSRVIKLFGSQLFLIGPSREEKFAYWDTLDISCTGARINIPINAVIKDMTAMVVADSEIMEEGARFGSFLLKMDSTSTASLRSGSLDKIKSNKP